MRSFWLSLIRPRSCLITFLCRSIRLKEMRAIHLGQLTGNINGKAVYMAGKVDQAIELNGMDSFVTLPSSHAMSTYDEITLATWVYWNGGNQWQRIFDFGNDTNQYMFLTPRSGNNTLRFAIKNGGSEQMVQTSQLAVNQWVHVACDAGNGRQSCMLTAS